MKMTSVTPPFTLTVNSVDTRSLHVTWSNVVQASFTTCFCCVPLGNVRRKPEASRVKVVKVLL